MANKQKTAVEWLVEQIECFGNKHELQMSWATLDDLVQRAKAMEKEQIVNACNSNFNYDESKQLLPTLDEQYYKETYE
jgi:hypothetical protein